MNGVRDLILNMFSTERLEDNLRKRYNESGGAADEEIERNKDESDADYQRAHFNNVLKAIRAMVGYGWPTDISEEDVLRTCRQIITYDLTYSSISDFVYGERRQKSDGIVIPNVVAEGDGIRELKPLRSRVFVDIKDKMIICTPDDKRKWREAMSRRALDAERMTVYSSLFYPNMDLVIIRDGRHRIAEGYINKDHVPVPVDFIDDETLLKRNITDGAFWKDRETGTVIRRVTNYRVALIFTLRQMELGFLPFNKMS